MTVIITLYTRRFSSYKHQIRREIVPIKFKNIFLTYLLFVKFFVSLLHFCIGADFEIGPTVCSQHLNSELD